MAGHYVGRTIDNPGTKAFPFSHSHHTPAGKAGQSRYRPIGEYDTTTEYFSQVMVLQKRYIEDII
jgi:hypothetical protein